MHVIKLAYKPDRCIDCPAAHLRKDYHEFRCLGDGSIDGFRLDNDDIFYSIPDNCPVIEIEGED